MTTDLDPRPRATEPDAVRPAAGASETRRPSAAAAEAPRSAGADRRAARLATPRLTRELRTIAAMLRIHCVDRHPAALAAAVDVGTAGEPALCAECAELLDYARKRLAGCPFGPEKPTCVNCQIHCYGPRQREAVRDVMRYAGPRMLLRHPVLAIAHVLDGKRPAPPRPRGAAAARPGPAAVDARSADLRPPSEGGEAGAGR